MNNPVSALPVRIPPWSLKPLGFPHLTGHGMPSAIEVMVLGCGPHPRRSVCARKGMGDHEKGKRTRCRGRSPEHRDGPGHRCGRSKGRAEGAGHGAPHCGFYLGWEGQACSHSALWPVEGGGVGGLPAGEPPGRFGRLRPHLNSRGGGIHGDAAPFSCGTGRLPPDRPSVFNESVSFASNHVEPGSRPSGRREASRRGAEVPSHRRRWTRPGKTGAPGVKRGRER